VGGPSAGLAFTLGILQRFSKTDLTRGHRIAVTGEIALDGSVGPIGGVKQKVIGARWAGAQYFLLPAANYDEARPYAQGLTLVPVHTIDEALAFLKKLK
jgi:PDZ domain-containing protein